MAHNISFRRIDRRNVAELTAPGDNQLQPGMWGYARQEEVFVIRTREDEFKFIPGRGLNIIGTFEGFPPSDANLAKIGNLCLVNNAVLGGQTLNGVLYQYQVEASGRGAWRMVGQIQGPKGASGIDGKPFTIKGNYPELVDLEEEHLEGTPGDFWTVGDADSGETLYLYGWDPPTDSWVRLGNIRGMRGFWDSRKILDIYMLYIRVVELLNIGDNSRNFYLTSMPKYAPQEIEIKWQKYWEENNTFRTPEPKEKAKKFYCLDMFPYPSGAGLHMGHPEGYTATDIICRYKRANGFQVLHPMGWDAFGLPAEQYAIQTGTHPAETTQKNCDTFSRQMKRLGFSYDWEREINTTDPKYYKWTQWIFSKLYNTWFDSEQNKGRPISELPASENVSEKRLAYYANAQVWWCRKCKTVCANEEVLADGSHEKCGTLEVDRRNLKQWLLRIPQYAERLLNGLENLDWSPGIKDMQRNWIGKSKGAEVDFAIPAGKLRVYTTRPDTLFGATYMVIAPEHPQTASLTTPEQKEKVEAYIKAAAIKTELDRTELAKEKTGVFTGSYAINPVNGKEIPIWVADYVLTGYGTGAIMAVPAHDTRDFEFAQKFGIPVVCIMEPDNSCPPELKEKILAGSACWTSDGKYICSDFLNGLSKKEGIAKITEWLEKKQIGKATTNYKIRDWLFSRQRYWGEPFPIIHWEDGEISLVDESEYPVLLPELSDYKPGDGGISPLAGATEWFNVVDKNGRKGKRELNTMPQWAGSCWYYLRYIDPKNDNAFVAADLEKFWMPVDLYVGGAEHAVLHLLYSRFWHKVLFDLGFVSTDEPFQKLFNQGMILAFAYETASGSKVPSDEVEEKDGKFYRKGTSEELKQIIAKMSKSLKNVVNPDDVVNQYGADSLRLYEMFMGPLDAVKPWQSQGMEGMFRFLSRAMRSIAGDEGSPEYTSDTPPEELTRLMHQSILKVGDDIENMRFNTAISQLMVFNNELIKQQVRYREPCETFVKLLHPFAPHLCEELWQILGHSESLTKVAWTIGSAELAAEASVEVVFQVNGKVRAKANLSKTLSKEDLEGLALQNEAIKANIAGKKVIKVIAVPDKLVNVVVSG